MCPSLWRITGLGDRPDNGLSSCILSIGKLIFWPFEFLMKILHEAILNYVIWWDSYLCSTSVDGVDMQTRVAGHTRGEVCKCDKVNLGKGVGDLEVILVER